MKKLLIFTSALLLSACSAIPDKLEVPKGTALYAYPTNAADVTEGQRARWGGYIATIENREDTTVLDIVNLKLGSSTRPIKDDETLGRFRVYIDGYLDPNIYQQGRLITTLGRTGQAETVLVGEHPLLQPTLQAKEIHLWPKETLQNRPVIYRTPFVYPRPIYVRH